jgi:hypothetical protein
MEWLTYELDDGAERDGAWVVVSRVTFVAIFDVAEALPRAS